MANSLTNASSPLQGGQLLHNELILERISDCLLAVDDNWNVTFWNQTAEEVLGKPKEELLNKNLWEMLP